jgi:hypothetical protein
VGPQSADGTGAARQPGASQALTPAQEHQQQLVLIIIGGANSAQRRQRQPMSAPQGAPAGGGGGGSAGPAARGPAARGPALAAAPGAAAAPRWQPDADAARRGAARLALLARVAGVAAGNGWLGARELWRLAGLSRGMRRALSEARVDIDLASVWTAPPRKLREGRQQDVLVFHRVPWVLANVAACAAEPEATHGTTTAAVAAAEGATAKGGAPAPAPAPATKARLQPVRWSVTGLCLDVRVDRLDEVAHLFQGGALRKLWLRHVFRARLAPSVTSPLGATLRELRILDAPSLDSGLTGLAPLQQLESLYLGNCAELLALDGLDALSRLEAVELVQLDALCEASALGRCPALRRLRLVSLPLLPGLGPLAQSRTLERLDVHALPLVADIPIEQLQCPLRELTLGFLPLVGHLTGLSRFRGTLRSLRLVAVGLFDLASLAVDDGGVWPLLRRLELRFLPHLASLRGIGAMPALAELSLEGDIMLADLDALKGCQLVRRLCIDHCRALLELPQFVLDWPLEHCSAEDTRASNRAELRARVPSRAAPLNTTWRAVHST